MILDNPHQTDQNEDWQRGYMGGLRDPGDLPVWVPGGLSGFNMGFIAGMKEARKRRDATKSPLKENSSANERVPVDRIAD
jgi:hypothetical protein